MYQTVGYEMRSLRLVADGSKTSRAPHVTLQEYDVFLQSDCKPVRNSNQAGPFLFPASHVHLNLSIVMEGIFGSIKSLFCQHHVNSVYSWWRLIGKARMPKTDLLGEESSYPAERALIDRKWRHGRSKSSRKNGANAWSDI